MRQCGIPMSAHRFRFGLFEFDATSRELRREGILIRLQSQPAQILALFLRSTDRIVSREELCLALWGEDTFVDFDRGLNFAVSQLRSALRDDANQPTYIRTVPKIGYQFIAPVTTIHEAPASPVTAPPAGKSLPRWPWIAVSAVLLAILLGGGAFLTARRQASSKLPVVAVLRFDNETGDPEMSQFSEALTDSVVEQLTTSGHGHDQIIGNALVLSTPRTQRDMRAIAASLNAQYIILGQVQGSKANLRVLAHLIHMPEQTHVWVVRQDRSANDPLNVESDLAHQIAAEFSPRIAAKSN